MEDKKMDEIINRIDALTEKVEQIIKSINPTEDIVISVKDIKCDGDKLKDIIAQKEREGRILPDTSNVEKVNFGRK